MAETIGKTDNAWLKLFEKYPIEEQTKNGGRSVIGTVHLD